MSVFFERRCAMRELFFFFGSFGLFLILYLLLVVRKYREYDPNKIPLEARYLSLVYHIDLRKVSYRKLLLVISFVSSFDMAVSFVVVFLISNIFLQILVGFFLLVLLILITYHFVGTYFLRKGEK